MRRGEIRWYSFRPPDKRRPVLILTRDSAIDFLTNVTVAPLTTTIRGIPTEVVLTPEEDGVPQPSAINLDNIQTIQQANLGRLIATVSLAKMEQVGEALKFALGLDE